jgi:hypothetical protein
MTAITVLLDPERRAIRPVPAPAQAEGNSAVAWGIPCRLFQRRSCLVLAARPIASLELAQVVVELVQAVQAVGIGHEVDGVWICSAV